jgi:hypothetical protein
LSTDNGATFTVLSGVAGFDTGAGVDRPTVATGPGPSPGQGSVWVAWTSSNGGIIAARGALVTGLGMVQAFGVTEFVPNPSNEGTGNFSSLAVGPSGQLVVAYQLTGRGADGNGIIATATDPDGLGPTGFLNPVEAATTNIGTSDDTPANQPVNPAFGINASPQIAFDMSNTATGGRLYLVGVSEPVAESQNMGINLVVSTNSGQTWNAVGANNGLVSDSTVNSRFDPALSVDPTTGFVAVTWYDARNDLGRGSSGDSDGLPNTEVSYWGAVSTDGGVTFSPNVQISSGISSSIRASSLNGLGRYTSSVFFNNVLHPAWADNSLNLAGNPNPQQLDIATSLVSLIPIAGTPLSNFIVHAYLDILGRLPDTGGLNFFTNLLNMGAPRAQVVNDLLSSDEYHARLIETDYETLLHRHVDAGGLQFGLELLRNLPIFQAGRNVEEVLRANILSSDEYFRLHGGTTEGFLEGLYQDVLGRGIDPAGDASFTSALNSGTLNRLNVAYALIFSPEGLSHLVQGYYNEFLRRPGDPSGVNFYVTMLEMGARDEEVIIALVSSDEYFARANGFPLMGTPLSTS